MGFHRVRTPEVPQGRSGRKNGRTRLRHGTDHAPNVLHLQKRPLHRCKRTLHRVRPPGLRATTDLPWDDVLPGVSR